MACALALVGCDRLEVAPAEPPAPERDARPAPAPEPAPEPPAPAPMVRPVPLWAQGRTEREVDAAAQPQGILLLDLGESWTPYLFSERSSPSEERIAHGYRETYLALARGEQPADHHGERAQRDKYLELYGILPTLGLLRERMRRVRDLECAAALDLGPLERFEGFAAYESNPVARRQASDFAFVARQVAQMMERQEVDTDAELDEARLDDRELARLRQYRSERPRHDAIVAAQARLECEGYFEGKGRWDRGAFDWATHEALAELERRHRIYGWGFLGGETLERLREAPLERERRAVVRELTERAMHALGVLEDGSADAPEGERPRTYRAADGAEHPVPNLERELETRIVRALGLDTPERTLDFLEGLGELSPGDERVVAIEAPALPDYYSPDMDLRVEIDRGDVWYEFPYDEQGRERAQPVQRRPRLSVYVQHGEQRILLARYGTTIGGWRSELIEGETWWKYKGSPPGPRIWRQIVSAPVWLPPESTPTSDLLARVPGRGGREAWRVNYHETGPSYASAYGLVAAYHLRYEEREDGTFVVRGDEGIRTHGSVDYMSIMRRHSHGCHRMHNHIAVRMMSFVLAHRPHRRVGHQAVGFRRDIVQDGNTYALAIDRGGYVFELERPLYVNVLEGRIRGERATPIETPLPRYDSEAQAYVQPDGTHVTVDRMGRVTPITPAEPVPGVEVADPRLSAVVPLGG